MPRKLYDPKVKAEFIAAARDAIKAGRGMAGALKAATDAGYTGGQSGLQKMLYAPKKKSKRAKTTPAVAPTAALKPAPSAPAAKKSGRKLYDPKVKAAFLAAASAARKADKSWAEAHAEATKAGYTGSVSGLVQQFLAKADKKKVQQAKKKLGRPVGSKNAKTPAVSGLGSLQSAIGRIVSERVSAAIGKAIKALRAAAE